MPMVAKIEITYPKVMHFHVNGGSVTSNGVEVRPFERDNDLDVRILAAIQNLEDVLIEAVKQLPKG